MQKIDYKTYVKPSDFLKLSEGDNIIRIVTEGIIATIYGMKTGQRWLRFGTQVDVRTKEKYGKSISSQRKWIWVALNRATGQVGLLEVGPVIGNAICEKARELAKDPREFDIMIKRFGTGMNTKYEVLNIEPSKEISTEVMERVKKEVSYLIEKYLV